MDAVLGTGARAAMALSDWDDSMLINAFNSAMSKYQEMHGMAPKRKTVSTASDEGHEVPTTSSDPLAEDLSLVDEELGRDAGNEDYVEVAEPAADAGAGAQAGVSITPRVEETIEQEQATWNEPYGYDAATAYENPSGNEQHPALQQILYHLQELEHHQQLLRQQLESWAGYASWQGMHQYGSNNFAQSYSGHSYPSGSPAVYPCYCHHHCHHPNFWPCRSPCGFVPPVYFPCAVSTMQQQAPCCQSFRSHSTQHLCQAMNQCCPGLSNPRQHVARTCQDSG